VQGCHAGEPGVEREQEVKGFCRPDLADDHAGRSHPQRLPDQVPQRHLTGALEPGLPSLERDPVGVRDAELANLLGADDPVAARDRRREAVQHRGLARLRAAGHDDVEAGPDCGVQEARRLLGQGAELDQLGEPRRAHDELADVDRREVRADAFQDDVEAVTLRQPRVDER
jgi:hypothetical protein